MGDRSKASIDNSIQQAIQNFVFIVMAMGYEMDRVDGWDTVFEIDPMDDDRDSFQVHFASRTILEKVVDFANRKSSPYQLSEVYQLLSQYHTMRLCADSMSECKPLPSTRSA
jgi:hypothetical protein